jgi:hypothetical protein
MKNRATALAITAGLCLFGGSVNGGMAAFDPPLLLMDRTGSLEHQVDVETMVAAAIAHLGAALQKIRILPFAERVLDVPALAVQWRATDGWQSGIGSLSSIQHQRAESRAREELAKVLGRAVVSPAGTTNIPAVLVRAGREPAPALVVSDFKNEVPRAAKLLTNARIQVVLCAAKGDRGDQELEITQRRQGAIKRWAPNAEMFSCSEIDAAVKRWVSTAVERAIDRASNPQ